MRRNATRSTNTFRLALLFIVMAVFTAACSSGSGSGESGGDTGGAVAPGKEDAGTPTSGGTIDYGLEAETTDGWCLPEGQLAISGIQVARSIYDTLTVPGKDGTTFTGMLAESVTPNDDYTEWTITLRPGIKFHDGTDLTAQVVANNLMAYRGDYPGRASLLFSFVLGDIVDDTPNDGHVSGITTEGDNVVKVQTSRPWVSFPSFLYSSGRMGMVAQAQLDAIDCARKLIGTGPFKLDDWRVNSSMKLSRNEDYWRKDADGTQLPYLDGITYHPQPEAQQLANGLQSGELDAFHLSSNTGALILEDMRDLSSNGDINLVESDDFAEVGNLMLNTTKPPFDNATAREAVALAINREESNEILSDNIPVLADGPFAPGALGYLEDTGFKSSDAATAKDLVQQYETETGLPFEFEITSGQDTQLAKQIDLAKQYFEEAGMTVRITNLEQSALIQKAIEKGYQMITWRNYPGFDPDNLYVWWYDASKNPVNFPGFNDPEVNDLLDRGRTTPDEAERKTIYEDLNRELNKEHYFLWTSWTLWAIPMAKDVHGVVGARPVDGALDGSDDYTGLAVGHDPAFLWKES
ncbi:MAG TPA: ABC transporter substrate-binding protein [Acidimicrobiales bacterium]